MREMPGLYVQQIAIRNQLEERRREAAAMRRVRTARCERCGGGRATDLDARSGLRRFQAWPLRLWQALRWGHA